MRVVQCRLVFAAGPSDLRKLSLSQHQDGSESQRANAIGTLAARRAGLVIASSCRDFWTSGTRRGSGLSGSPHRVRVSLISSSPRPAFNAFALPCPRTATSFRVVLNVAHVPAHVCRARRLPMCTPAYALATRVIKGSFRVSHAARSLKPRPLRLSRPLCSSAVHLASAASGATGSDDRRDIEAPRSLRAHSGQLICQIL